MIRGACRPGLPLPESIWLHFTAHFRDCLVISKQVISMAHYSLLFPQREYKVSFSLLAKGKVCLLELILICAWRVLLCLVSIVSSGVCFCPFCPCGCDIFLSWCETALSSAEIAFIVINRSAGASAKVSPSPSVLPWKLILEPLSQRKITQFNCCFAFLSLTNLKYWTVLCSTKESVFHAATHKELLLLFCHGTVHLVWSNPTSCRIFFLHVFGSHSRHSDCYRQENGGKYTFVGGAGADYLKADSSMFAIMFPLHGLFGETSPNKVYLLQ